MSEINYCENQYNVISTNQNYGYSSRMPYDESTYQDKLHESVAPLYYRLNPDRIHNRNACLPTFGSRSSYKGYGASMPVHNGPAVSQSPEMVNIESILTNRNVLSSKNRRNQVNPIDVTKFQVKHPRVCSRDLDPIASRLSEPPMRETGINRFYSLHKHPQSNIFWNFAEDTKLSAKNAYTIDIPKLWSINSTLPHEIKSKNKCKTVKVCPINDNSINYEEN